MDLPVPLPPSTMRRGGRLADERYVETGLEDVRELSAVGLTGGMRVVDFGCGPGRMAIGLIASGWSGSYLGVEVSPRQVKWATDNISAGHPAFEFVRVDAANERYNPKGSEPRRLPVDDRTVDLLFAYSVFTHMMSAEALEYLIEIRRALAPAGRAFVTAFLADDVPDETENPAGMREWSGALHCVVYRTGFFLGLVEEAGLAVREVVDRNRQQDGLVLARQ